MSPENSRNENDIHILTVRSCEILRNLRNSLRQLGLDKAIEELAGDIPGARERLGHVVTLTQEAADSVLLNVETAMPGQERLSKDADSLKLRWNALSEGPEDKNLAYELATETRAWLINVRQVSSETSQQLHAIMMAQGFQDVTGQIVQHMVGILNQVEQQLIQLLRDTSPGIVSPGHSEKLSSTPSSTLPASQDDVDDLLASLGL